MRGKNSNPSKRDIEAGERLRRIWDAKAKGLGLTQEKAGLRMDMTQGAVHQYLTSKIALGLEAVLKFASILKVDPREIRDDLPGLDGAAPLIPAYSVRAIDGEAGASDTDVMVPLVDVELSAGAGAAVFDFIETQFMLPYQVNWLRKHNVKSSDDVRLMAVRGDSMERTLFSGDLVLVHLKANRIKSDTVFAITLDGEAMVKRLFNTAHGVRIVSDNQDKVRYPDELLPTEQVDRLKIIGQAIDKHGSGGL